MATLWRVRTAITGGGGGNQVSTQFFETTAGSAQDAADSVRAFWSDAAALIANNYQFQVEPVVYEIDSTTGQATGTVSTSTAAVTGGSTAVMLPNATQGLVRYHTGVFTAGRELIGKIFVPGPVQDYNNDGLPSSSYKSTLTTAGSNLGNSGPPDMVIYSRTHHVYAPAGLATVWNEWAILRSRRT